MEGLGHQEMAGVEGAGANNNVPTAHYSSSPELSSPPRSLSDPSSPAARQLSNDLRNSQNLANRGVEVQQIQPPMRRKPGRKPKILDTSSVTTSDGVKVRKVRKPREPRDPNLPPIQRRKKAIEADGSMTINVAPGGPRQKITEVAMRPVDPRIGVPKISPDPIASSQKGKNEDIRNSFFNAGPPPPQPLQAPPAPQAPPQAPPVRTSGQNYDPIRSNYDPVRENVMSHHPFSTPPQMSPQPSHIVNRASASPSISSLVDPPIQPSTSPSMAPQSFFQQRMQSYDGNRNSLPSSPTTSRLVNPPLMAPTFSSNLSLSQPLSPPQPIFRQEKSYEPPANVVAQPLPPPPPPPPIKATPAPAATAMVKTSSSSATASPKPTKPIDITPPPLPGSGGMFGMGNGPNDGTESRAPTIVLHIPMNGESNKYVNFTRLAEEHYGWDALHPRLAAQRERLARVAAAGAALEKSGSPKESGEDEMSLDMSDGEGSNAEMGGMSDARTGTDGATKKVVRKRKTKEDEYDKDDGFVDDSEMLWEEQAAASKDGFFVYSGPLVPEGEKPVLDRADGAPKRGRGSRGRGGSARGSASTRGGTTGGGPGSRGGTTTRKPRMTKADRARMDLEKVEREKMASLAAKPSGYGAMTHLSNTMNMGGTPMVFNQ